MTESFDSFLTRLSSQATSRDAIARAFAIERYWGARGDGPRTPSDKQHILTMCAKHPHRFEIRHGANHWAPYIKQPGSLTLVPAGECPLLRAETEFDLVVCAFDSKLMSVLDSELRAVALEGEGCVCRRTSRTLLHSNWHDPLLSADANEGHTTERLYTEYLAQALAVRMLFLGSRTKPPSNNNSTYGLPRHVLRRIIERMRSFDSNLSLQALANESGYSRVHFVRMFRAATGSSPHNYLLNLKLERARELLKKPVDVTSLTVSDCGFFGAIPT